MVALGLYSVEDGCNEDSEGFCEIVQKVVNNINRNDYVIVTGDFNGRVENFSIHSTVGSYDRRKENGN